MAYIGNTVRSVPFIVDTFSGNASATNFTLTRAPASTTSIAVFVNGAYQQPTANYSLDVTTISFTVAPPTATNNIQVLHIGEGQIASQVPSDATVTTPKMAANVAVTAFTANTSLRVPVYTSNTTRNSTITTPQIGMVIISGTQFQGYDGSGWVVLNNN
jgi:hypothetical protein